MNRRVAILLCGWVLWSYMTPSNGKAYWHPMESYEKLDECKRDAFTVRSDFSSLSPRPKVEKTFVCLPGTLNPSK